jgi:hypothetical protein
MVKNQLAQPNRRARKRLQRDERRERHHEVIGHPGGRVAETLGSLRELQQLVVAIHIPGASAESEVLHTGGCRLRLCPSLCDLPINHRHVLVQGVEAAKLGSTRTLQVEVLGAASSSGRAGDF